MVLAKSGPGETESSEGYVVTDTGHRAFLNPKDNIEDNDDETNAEGQLVDSDESEKPVSTEGQQKVGFIGMISNQILTCLGTGILSMPKYMAASGILNALVILGISLILNYYCVMALVHAAEKYRVYEMEGLVEKLRRGKFWSKVCWWGVQISFGLVLMCYMTTFRQALQDTEGSFRSMTSSSSTNIDPNNSSENNFQGLPDIYTAVIDPTNHEDNPFSTNWDFSEALLKWQAQDFHESSERIFGKISSILICCACVLPLCFFPQKWLAYTSGISVVVNIFVLLAILLNFFKYHKNQSSLVSDNGHDEGTWMAYDHLCILSFDPVGSVGYLSTTMMAICVQPCLVPMYEEMDHPRTPQRFALTMKISSIFCFVLFGIFSIAAYSTFGNELKGNVLMNLPQNEWYTAVTQCGMLITMVSAFPLMLLPMVNGFKNPFTRTVVTFALVLASCILGILCADVELDVLLNLTGALSVFFFLALFPALIALQLLSPEFFGGKEHVEDGEAEDSDTNTKNKLKLISNHNEVAAESENRPLLDSSDSNISVNTKNSMSSDKSRYPNSHRLLKVSGSLSYLSPSVKTCFFYFIIAFGFIAMILGMIWPSADLKPGTWKNEDELKKTWMKKNLVVTGGSGTNGNDVNSEGGLIPLKWSEKRAHGEPVPTLPEYQTAVKTALKTGERPIDIMPNRHLDKDLIKQKGDGSLEPDDSEVGERGEKKRQENGGNNCFKNFLNCKCSGAGSGSNDIKDSKLQKFRIDQCNAPISRNLFYDDKYINEDLISYEAGIISEIPVESSFLSSEWIRSMLYGEKIYERKTLDSSDSGSSTSSNNSEDKLKFPKRSDVCFKEGIYSRSEEDLSLYNDISTHWQEKRTKYEIESQLEPVTRALIIQQMWKELLDEAKAESESSGSDNSDLDKLLSYLEAKWLEQQTSKTGLDALERFFSRVKNILNLNQNQKNNSTENNENKNFNQIDLKSNDDAWNLVTKVINSNYSSGNSANTLTKTSNPDRDDIKLRVLKRIMKKRLTSRLIRLVYEIEVESNMNQVCTWKVAGEKKPEL